MASGIQYAGEYTLEDVRLFASSGNIIPLNGLVISISLFESIFSPTMSGTITLLDANSIVSNLPIIGQEFLSFKIKTASITEGGTSVIDFTKNPFSVYKIDQRIEGTNSELITLHFASSEMLRNLRTRVSKSYTDTIDNIAIDVIQNSSYINSKKDLFVEETVGVRRLISPNSNPFTFIQKLSSEAISKKNGSPFFLFYENKEGFNFRSLDSLYAQPITAEYNTGEFYHQENSGTVVKNVLDEYSRPISHEMVAVNDTASNVRGGLLASDLITYDIYGKRYERKKFRYFNNFNDYGRLGNSPIYNTNFIDEFDNTVDNFTNANIHLHSTSKEGENDAQFYSVDPNVVVGSKNVKSLYSPNGIENTLLPRQSKFVELNKGVSLNVKVHGSTNISVGQIIQFNKQTVGNANESGDFDPYYTGRYIISNLRHVFELTPKKEHSIVMSLVKDGYEQELEQNTAAREPKNRFKGVVSKNII